MQKIFCGMSLGVLLFVAGCDLQNLADRISPLSAKPVATPSSKMLSPTALEKSVHEQVNKYRVSRKLPPLTLDSRIIEQARIHSQNMANGKVPFSHNGFEQRVDAIGKSISYRGAAENVAYNLGFQEPDRNAVEGWIKSPGHRKNMEGDYNLTGIGIAKNAKGEYYFTQIFIRS
ncbi:CAP domain-containing protein [Kamptonema sp. UHCC 0994]|uniref:CAP domain-containing protein n=1 Tax=Kamptonema sp. UHCC 0994 TaxID=3031329 RepID=UPI0023B98B50|nr:CAP domain-containing protein [Kamptonema sp. UHCC 0994]MDF0555326.1 CAP domain-containing protein [Kamptonema sp. UHCC 0994]